MNRAAWLELRRSHITATDIAKAVTGRYGGAYAAVLDKLEPEPDTEPTAAMQRGLDAETAIARAVEALTGLTVTGEQRVAHHPDRPEFMATLDGELADSTAAVVAGLEIKTAARDIAWDYYETQIQWQQFVTGVPVTILAVGRYADRDGIEVLTDLKLRSVSADPDVHMQLRDIADRLYGYVTSRLLPPPDGSKFTSDLVRSRWRTADLDADPVDLADLQDLIEERAAIKERLDADKTAVTAIESTIIDRLGTATDGTVDGWRVTYRPSMGIDMDALTAAHPDTVAEHTTTTTVVDMAAVERAVTPRELRKFKTVPGTRRLYIKEKS